MIVIRAELWPGGDKERASPLGTCVIVNDGTGSLTRGNYRVRLSTKRGFKDPRKPKPGEVWRECRVEEFPRKRFGTWDIMHKALRTMLRGRWGDG